MNRESAIKYEKKWQQLYRDDNRRIKKVGEQKHFQIYWTHRIRSKQTASLEIFIYEINQVRGRKRGSYRIPQSHHKNIATLTNISLTEEDLIAVNMRKNAHNIAKLPKIIPL